MALIACPNCTLKVSDTRDVCVHCNQPLSAESRASSAPSLAAAYGGGAGGTAVLTPPARRAPSSHRAPAPAPAPARSAPPVAESDEPLYFAVSPLKMTLMSICTAGLYEFYAIYKHWQVLQRRTGLPISPFWRGFFAPIFVFDLFKRIREEAEEAGLLVKWTPSGMGWAFFAISMAWRLPDPYSLVSYLSFIPLLSVQQTVSALHAARAPRAATNSGFTPGNVMTLIIGGLLMAAVVLQAFVGTK